MTALNVILSDRHATIFSDTLGRKSVGRDLHVPKVMPVPHLKLAVGTRGPMTFLGKAIGEICGGAFDFDSARAYLATHYSKLNLDDGEIVVAGWSELKRAPAAFAISALNTGSKIFDVESVLISPLVSEDVANEFAANPGVGIPKLMHAQAAKHSNGVGGAICVCQVGETEIVSYCG